MTMFWSCHLIVNQKLPDYRRHVRDFIDADFLLWRGISALFFKWTSSKNANLSSRYHAQFGKTLNLSAATFTASNPPPQTYSCHGKGSGFLPHKYDMYSLSSRC